MALSRNGETWPLNDGIDDGCIYRIACQLKSALYLGVCSAAIAKKFWPDISGMTSIRKRYINGLFG